MMNRRKLADFLAYCDGTRRLPGLPNGVAVRLTRSDTGAPLASSDVGALVTAHNAASVEPVEREPEK